MTALREMAPRYGFGFVDGWHKIGRSSGPGAGGGVPVELLRRRARAGRLAITENVLAGDLPRLVVFIGRDLTRRPAARCAPANARRLWASRRRADGAPDADADEWLAAGAMLAGRRGTSCRAP